MRKLPPLFYRSLYLSAIVVCLCSLFIMLFPIPKAEASSLVRFAPVSTHLRQEPITSKSVTILVLDMSGSMSENDPLGLRCSAARAFIDLSGPGNAIGLVDLDGTGTSGGAHNFEQTQNWSNDVFDMSTIQNRNHLKDLLSTQSKNCQPHADTPTYDALNKAAVLLGQATQGHEQEIAGSVLLLTDGNPYPDTIGQFQAIKSDLLPQFRQHHWPIYTVGLGKDEAITDATSPFHSLHDFLSGVSNSTGARFYDDSQGVSAGISPLNIAPFFVDVYARQNNRTVHDDIPPTSAPGDRNFVVTRYTDTLNVVVIKDTANTRVVLKDPQGKAINGRSDISNSSDDYYTIFSIDQPQEGNWILSVTGTGQFLMKSLKTSQVNLTNITLTQNNRLLPSLTSTLAIGQPITVHAQLVNNGISISDNTFSIDGTISKNNVTGPFTREVGFDNKQTPGIYTATFTIPEDQAGGTYTLTITVANGSLALPISNKTVPLSILRFPEPVLLSPQTHQPVQSGSVAATAVNWGILGKIYDPPVPILQDGMHGLSQWPLSDEAPNQGVKLDGQLLFQNQRYTGAEISLLSVVRNGTTQPVAAQLITRQDGTFHLFFSAIQEGDYTATFQTMGSFSDSYGNMGTFQRTVHVGVRTPIASEIAQAVAVTILYLLCLILAIYIGKYILSPHPFGSYETSQDDNEGMIFEFRRARRGPAGFFKPNLISSHQAKMPHGLLFRFIRGGSIEVRPQGTNGRKWFNQGRELKPGFQSVSELWFNPPDGSSEMTSYTIHATSKKAQAGDDDEGQMSWDWN